MNKLQQKPIELLAEFKALPNWLLWRSEKRGGKLTKVPFTTRGKFASSTNPKTWASYADVVAVADKYCGIGFVLANGYGLIDLDGCRNPETGLITPGAQAIVSELESYTEISPSGTGLHIYVKDKLGDAHSVTRKQFGVEIYAGIPLAGRYTTITQDHLSGTPTEIASINLSAFNADVEAGAYNAKPQVLANPATIFDFDKWLDTHPVEILSTKSDGTYEVTCPGTHGNYDKRDGRAFLKKMESGAASMGCLHSSCSLFHETGNHWTEFRAAYEGSSDQPRASFVNTVSFVQRSSAKWPDPLAEEAFHGIAGNYVRLVEPASEADPAALLLQFLVMAGNVIGHRPAYCVEATRHHLNLFAVLVGLTSKARKGTSWGLVKRVFGAVAQDWATECLATGLSSGEGLIEKVRDPDEKGENGVHDKRLMVNQGEFSSVLRSMDRSGNTLSMVLRDAWDDEMLSTMTRKNNALRATDAHISLIGHITRDELRATLSETDKANGFANRILWICVGRSKELPDSVDVDEKALLPIMRQVANVLQFAQNVTRIQRDEDAKAVWRAVYHDLSEGHPGMFGAVTSRGEAQVVRLSSLYAVLDKSAVIQAEHMQAALAVWQYCEDSARYIFGQQLGDPVADAIVAAIKESATGLTRTEMSFLFGKNKSSERIEQALTLLQEHGRIARRTEKTEGRSREVWFAV
jgi:hypothetical protein